MAKYKQYLIVTKYSLVENKIRTFRSGTQLCLPNRKRSYLWMSDVILFLHFFSERQNLLGKTSLCLMEKIYISQVFAWGKCLTYSECMHKSVY